MATQVIFLSIILFRPVWLAFQSRLTISKSNLQLVSVSWHQWFSQQQQVVCGAVERALKLEVEGLTQRIPPCSSKPHSPENKYGLLLLIEVRMSIDINYFMSSSMIFCAKKHYFCKFIFLIKICLVYNLKNIIFPVSAILLASPLPRVLIQLTTD